MRDVIKECVKRNLSVSQLFALSLVEINSTGARQYIKDYVKQFGPPSEEDLISLMERDLVYAPFKIEGPYYYYDLAPIRVSKESLLDMADELWNYYPATFPLSSGGCFISRTGGSKELLLQQYLEKIEHSVETHKFVLQQLSRYVNLVSAGKINGHKISEWITNEMWNTIASIPEEEDISLFKEDI